MELRCSGSRTPKKAPPNTLVLFELVKSPIPWIELRAPFETPLNLSVYSFSNCLK